MPCSVASVLTPCIVAWGRLQRKPQARLVDPGLLAMAQRQRRTLMQLMRAMKSIVEDMDKNGDVHPDTTAALRWLESAANSEWGQGRAQSPARASVKRLMKRMKQAAWYQKRRRAAAEEQLRELKTSRVKGVLTLEWIARVGRSPPHLPSRTLRESLVGILPDGSEFMSKVSTNRVRDAFAELVKELAAEELSAFVAQNIGIVVAFGVGPATGADGCADPSLLSFAWVHLHGEAALRLRSHLDERLTQAPSRSRGSKVQQHVLTWHIGVAACEVPVELEALADK